MNDVIITGTAGSLPVKKYKHSTRVPVDFTV